MGPISGACLIPTNPFSRNSSTFTPPGARNEPAPASAARENAPSNHELFEVSEYSLIELGIRVKWTPHAEERAIERTNPTVSRSEEHTSELQSRGHLVCRLLLEKKK